MTTTNGALQSAGMVEFHEAGASGRVASQQTMQLITRTEADFRDKRLAINNPESRGIKCS